MLSRAHSLRGRVEALTSLSLSGRLALVAACVLTGFLGLTGTVLDRAFRISVEEAVREKLQIQVYLLLEAADFDESAQLLMPDVLPEPRLSFPASGLYAEIAHSGGRAHLAISVKRRPRHPLSNPNRGATRPPSSRLPTAMCTP